jgi:hypothetical protein
MLVFRFDKLPPALAGGQEKKKTFWLEPNHSAKADALLTSLIH